MKPKQLLYSVQNFFMDLLDLKKAPDHDTIEVENDPEENDHFQSIFIIVLLYALLLISGFFS
ncbi:hypothetical protein D770_20620 [Flammeovirgaceae bacterium 311]|nr:hypothetical protein D770_20620 [Flammeovirgaceae bacterium 311]